MSDTLNSKVAEWDGLVAIAHQIVHGNSDLSVMTEGGAVRSFAKLMADKDAEINNRYDGAIEQAESSADTATAARIRAELARDVAAQFAGIYASAPAGITATNALTSKYFSVPSPDSSESLILYLNSAGVAVEQKRYPSASALDFKQGTNASLLMLADGDGNPAIKINATVEVLSAFNIDSTGGIGTSGLAITRQTLRSGFSYGDMDGNLLFEFDDLGRLNANFALAPIPSSVKRGGTYDYEVNHVFTYGQSLSVGQASPVISTLQKYDNLMFSRGMIPQYSYVGETAAQWYAALVPALEATSPANPAIAETPNMGTGDAIKERILAEDGLAFGSMKYQLLLSSPGYGATSINELSKGSAHFARMLEQATYGLALSNAAGKTYAVQAVTWTQGESDYIYSTPQATYVTKINTLVSDLNADIKVITGQAKSIPLITYQVASHKVYARTVPLIALGQLEAEASNPLVYMACPMYQFEYAGETDAHLTANSSRWLGAYYGLAYKRIVIDGLDWKPCKPLSSLKQGAIAMVKFHVPAGRLTLDTTGVAANTNHGFELVSAAGAALTISSISIAGPDTVKVAAAAPIPAGARLRYAWSGAGTVGSTNGPRGNLRDSQGDTIIFDPTGINKPLHNWCVIFEIGL